MKKQVLAALLFAVSANLHAAPNIIGDQFWLEVTAGNKHAGFQLKTAQGNEGWALGVFGYEDTQFFSTNSYYNNDGTRQIDESVSEIGVLRFYRKHTRFLYSDFGFGLGYVEGTEAKNCLQQSQSGGFYSHRSNYFCDEVDIRSPSIPIEAKFHIRSLRRHWAQIASYTRERF